MRVSILSRLFWLVVINLVCGCTASQLQSEPPHATAHPVEQASWWQPSPEKPIHWSWQLSDTFVFPRDVRKGVTVYDLDGELTTAETVAMLHSLGPEIRVICYVEVGVYETYRSDAERFPQELIGNPVKGWEDSFWLDIRQTEVLLPILKDRIQHWCKDKGFDAVEPDDSEVWTNKPGFPITRSQNHSFLHQLADIIHFEGLSAGLKNNTAEALELEPYFDWMLNEDCWLYEECEPLLRSFILNGKAVFNVEYNTDPNCMLANSWRMNSTRRDLDLTGPANPAYRYSPCIPDDQNQW